MDSQVPNTSLPAWRCVGVVVLALATAASADYLAPVGPGAASLPPFLAYLLGQGRHWLIALALVTLGVAQAPRSARLARAGSWLLGAIEGRRVLGWLFFALLVVVGFARVPVVRRGLVDIAGDEPKYLRIALSLVNDTDVDVSGGRETAPDLALRLKQLRSVALATRDAVVGLVRPAGIPPDHRWDAGNWSIRGRHGGEYYLQPPGLPAMLALFIGFGQAAFPALGPASLAAAFLVCCWVLGALMTYALARDVLASRPAALLSTALLFSTAPVFVGGYFLYPESAALFLVPFCYRRLRGSDRTLRSGEAIAAGLVAGGLFWIHPKFVALSVVLLAIGLLRPRATVRARWLLAGAFALAAGSSLLYVHHLTGLFRPEGLYVRQAEEYVGVPSLVSLGYFWGLANGLLGARDGIFVLAPVLLLGVAAVPAALAARRRTTLELLAIFGAVWFTAAVHSGVSLGPPARLFVPVAFAPMLVLALAIRQVGLRPRVLIPVLLLSCASLAVTAWTASYWRLSYNPYRGLFVTPAGDFTRDLPSRNRPTATAAADVGRAVLLLATAVALGLRWRRKTVPDTTAGVEGVCLLGVAVALAFGLDALGRWLPGGGP